MTKQESENIKKILKQEAIRFNPYFKSKTGELRIEVISFHTGRADEALVEEKYKTVLNALSKNEISPEYRKEQKIYQGFLDCRYLVFK